MPGSFNTLTTIYILAIIFVEEKAAKIKLGCCSGGHLDIFKSFFVYEAIHSREYVKDLLALVEICSISLHKSTVGK